MTQPPNHPNQSSQPDASLSFEDALARLEEIIVRIESGEVGLEKAIGEYERGVALIRRCKDILQKAEQRVDELTRLPQAGSAAGTPSGPASD